MAFTPLPDQSKADLFLHLALMERSGLPPDKAFALLTLPAGLNGRLGVLRGLLNGGADIAAAGLKSGLFSEFEARLVAAACHAGSPARTYQRLAQRHALKARNAALVRSRMALPLVSLLIALAVQPLPALLAGSVTGPGYLLSILRPFLVLAGCVFLYRFCARRLSVWTDRPTPVQTALSGLITRLPLFGAMVVRKNLRDFYENLALLLEAGVPMLDALPKALRTVGLCTIRADFAILQTMLERGSTLSQAVANLQFQTRCPVQGYIVSGEASGALPEMMLRFADGESEALAHFQAGLATWGPRLFYALVAVWMACQILNRHAIWNSG